LALEAGEHAAAAQAIEEMLPLSGDGAEQALTLLSHRAHQLALAGDNAEACATASKALDLIEEEGPLKEALEAILDAFA
jgi:hypothetical protein